MNNNALPRDEKERKKRLGTLIAGAAIVCLFLSSIILAVHPIASAILDDSPFVVLVRHGDAPGRGEPDGFDLSDCRTQRNLSDKGRDDARKIGQMVRASGINVTKVLTSRWCRARETAELMKLRSIENAATFDDLSFNKQHAEELLDGEHELIASWHGPGALLVVTHGSNIKALTGIDLEQGTMVVVSAGQGRLVGQRFSTFPAIAAQNCTGCF